MGGRELLLYALELSIEIRQTLEIFSHLSIHHNACCCPMMLH